MQGATAATRASEPRRNPNSALRLFSAALFPRLSIHRTCVAQLTSASQGRREKQRASATKWRGRLDRDRVEGSKNALSHRRVFSPFVPQLQAHHVMHAGRTQAISSGACVRGNAKFATSGGRFFFSTLLRAFHSLVCVLKISAYVSLRCSMFGSERRVENAPHHDSA